MDIHHDLRSDLQRMIGSLGKNMHSAMVGGAAEILTHYLGVDFFRNNFSSNKPDPFLGDFSALADSTSDYQYRFMTWASYVFSLREADGFDTLIQRFKTREVRQTYFEARAMHLLQKEGFETKMRPETGIKGQDFDFVAVAHGRHLNVEVTALTAPHYREATVKNALDQKRKQVPNDAPALLYCTIPFAWIEEEGPNLHEKLEKSAQALFRHSRRFNVVVFSWDPVTVIGERQMRGIVSIPIPNKKPYFVEDLGFLYNSSAAADATMRALAEGAIPEADLFELSYRSLIEEMLPSK